MKLTSAKLGIKAKNYQQGPELMRNEVDMWHAGGSMLLQEIVRSLKSKGFGGLQQDKGYEFKQRIGTPTVLDVCCGPGNFSNHLSLYVPTIKVTGIDINRNFLNYARKAHYKKGWKFLERDVTYLDLGSQFDFVVASSAYHHIPDKGKIQFLKRIGAHLKNNGKIIICENFLPRYTPASRKEAIDKYYKALIEYYSRGNAEPEAISLIKRVRQLELSGQEEHKVDFRRFKQHIQDSGLEIKMDRVIWQPNEFYESNAGSHVFLICNNFQEIC